MPFAATWMGLKMIILSEIGQIEKGKYITLHLCGSLKRIQMNLFVKHKLTDIENKLMLIKGEQGGKGYLRSLGLTDTHYYV